MSVHSQPIRRSIIPVFVVVAIDSMGMGIVLPLLPFYAAHFGASPSTVGALIAIFSLSQFFTGPVLGAWSDTTGRKHVLQVCMAGTAISLLMLAVADSLALVFLARIIGGLSAGSVSVAAAYAVDRSTPETRKESIGIVSAGIGVGLIIGPSLSALSSELSPVTPIWIAMMMAVAALLATQCLLPPEAPHYMKTGKDQQEQTTLAGLLCAPVVSIMSMLTFFYVALGMVMGGLAIYLARNFAWMGHPFSTREVGMVFTGTGIINIVVQLVLLKVISRRLTNQQLIFGSFLLMAVGYSATGLIQNAAWLIPSLTASALGSALLRPTLMSALSLAAPPGRQGVLLGINQSLMAAGNIAGPLLAGLLLSNGLDSIWLGAITACYLTGAAAALCFSLTGSGHLKKETHHD